MKQFLLDVAVMLVGRCVGPLTLRLILQPSVATLLAMRAGLHDERAGENPYFWSLLFHPSRRGDLLRSGWKDVRNVFCLAVFFDVIYQVIVFHWVYPVQALLVAAVLALIPYIMIRGVTARISGLAKKGSKS